MTFFYLDASAIVKRYVLEPGTELVDALFERAPKEQLTALFVALGEVLSVIVRRRNAGQLTQQVYQRILMELRHELIDSPEFAFCSVTDELVRASLPLIETYSINASDALVLRSALDLASTLARDGSELVVVTSDIRLAQAATACGLSVLNPERDTESALDRLLANASGPDIDEA